MNNSIFRKASKKEKTFRIMNNFIMIFLAFITLYPMLYVVFASFSDPAELAKETGLLLRPAVFSLDGYKAVMESENVRMGFRNTLFYTVVGTTVNMFLTILGAYVMAQKGYLLKKPFTIMIMITMYFGGGMIPTFLVVKDLNLLNTVWAIIIPGAISTYNMIVLRTSFESVPDSLLESAKIDGANDWTVLWNIVLPLSKAGLATIALFYAVGRWGEWYSALVYLQKRRDLYPLQMFLRELLVLPAQNDRAYAENMIDGAANAYILKEVTKYATIVVSTVPILVVYPFLQKYFVKGVMVGAVKG